MTIRDEIAEIIDNNLLVYMDYSDDATPHELTKHLKNCIDKILALPIMKKCDSPTCENGKVKALSMHARGNDYHYRDCIPCKGKEEVPVMHEVECQFYGHSPDIDADTQPMVEDGKCPHCKGTGKITRPKTLKDKIKEK